MGRTIAGYKKDANRKKLNRKYKYEVLPKKEFAKEMNKRALKYIKDVSTGKIIVNTYIKQAVQRGIDDRKRTDLYFNQKAIDEVYMFFSYLFIPMQGRPEQFKLTPYQAWILYELFGYYNKADDTRRFRYMLLYTARKSGKTMFAIAILLFGSIKAGEYNSEEYMLANTRDQAGQGLKYMKSIVKNSPALTKRVSIRRFDLYHELNGDCVIRSLASKAESLDGLSANYYLIDEIHAMPDLSLYNVMKSSTLARFNPLGIIASTAGVNKDYPFFGMLERAKKVLAKENENDSMFIALYTLDDDDDVSLQENWIKSNPNIGATIPLQSLVTEWTQAKDSIIEKYNFINKNLNVYLDNIEQWIPDKDYRKVFNEISIEKMQGWRAWAGIDLSSTRDFSSLIFVVENPDTKLLHVVPEFYFPQNEKNMLRTSGVSLLQWVEKGHIRHQIKPTIDFDDIFERIAYWNDFFDLQQIHYDKFNSSHLITKVQMELGVTCNIAAQNASYFSFPLKYLEKKIFDEDIMMSKNPVLRWQFRNIVLYHDGNNNVKIMKNKSQDAVDGPVALAMGIGAYLDDTYDFEEFAISDWTDSNDGEIKSVSVI